LFEEGGGKDNALELDGVARGAEACRVVQVDGVAVKDEGLFEVVTGRTRNMADDGTGAGQQCIEQ
jgi:hypothetical protein